MEITMTSTKKKILEEILPLRIIREVEKWPVLYMRDCPEMPNTHFKNKVWNEVAKALIEDWDSYTRAEKECKIMGLTKKWRNLRDTFKRQMLVDKKRREGHNIKRKKYVYFKHMSFLLPHMQDTEEPEAAPAPRRKRAHAARAAAAAERDAQRLPHAQHDDLADIDEDKHFLMSLLPSLKRMNDDEKLTAKMEILKVIKDVRNNSVATMETYVCQLDLADEEPLTVKKELFIDAPDFKSVSECSGLSD